MLWGHGGRTKIRRRRRSEGGGGEGEVSQQRQPANSETDGDPEEGLWEDFLVRGHFDKVIDI